MRVIPRGLDARGLQQLANPESGSSVIIHL
jgi:hypothetical protein